MYRRIRCFLHDRSDRIKLDGHFSTSVKLREGVHREESSHRHSFLLHINNITTVLSRQVSNTPHADNLVVWSASETTISSAYRIQEAVNKVEQWTNDWGLQISEVKTQALSTSKEKVAIKPLPQVEIHTVLGVKLDTRLSWKPHRGHGEKKLHQEAFCPVQIVWNTLGCQLQDSKHRLRGSSPTISGIWGQCLGDSSQDAHQQT